MLKNLAVLVMIFSSTLYAIQYPDLFGQAYNVKTSSVTSGHKPQEFGTGIAPPSNFKAETIGHNWAILSWEPTDKNNSRSYHLYRNNVLLTELSANQNIYKDKFLVQNHPYKYEIFTLDYNGWRSKGQQVDIITLKNFKPLISNEKDNISFKNINGIGLHIYTFKATDENQDPLYYKIKGKDADKFLIHQSTGSLINRNYLLREASYYITIVVSDGMDTSELAITIKT